MEFYDPDYSWQIFVYLESFKNDNGSWNFTDVLGTSVMNTDEKLVNDLLTWRWLKSIVDYLKSQDDWINEEDGGV